MGVCPEPWVWPQRPGLWGHPLPSGLEKTASRLESELARGEEGRRASDRTPACAKARGPWWGRMGPVGPRGRSARRELGKRPRALCAAVRTPSRVPSVGASPGLGLQGGAGGVLSCVSVCPQLPDPGHGARSADAEVPAPAADRGDGEDGGHAAAAADRGRRDRDRAAEGRGDRRPGPGPGPAPHATPGSCRGGGRATGRAGRVHSQIWVHICPLSPVPRFLHL